MGLGKGIGPVTVSIFLRDMREIWPKAGQELTPDVKKTASLLGIKDVKAFARGHGLGMAELLTALHRYSRSIKKAQKAEKAAFPMRMSASHNTVSDSARA